MSKPYSETDFSSQVVEDRTWRIKEISDLKTAIKRGDESLKRVLLRAIVTISYAHWEGYVKFSAKKYLEHVALRKFQYVMLDKQFYRNYFLGRLATLSTSKIGIAGRCAIVEEILTSETHRFERVNDDLVNTKSNLNFEVFADICLICGVSSGEFSDKADFIDKILLRRRNEIAPGEDTLVALDDLDEVADVTINLMRAFGDALENHVVLQSYRV